MSTKGRMSLSLLATCEKCQTTVGQRDMPLHEANCPPTLSLDKWDHGFIHNQVLYNKVEVYKPQELPKNLTELELSDMIFISQSAMELCEIAIGDPVVVTAKDNIFVKTAWPTNEKTLTSISLTKSAIELYKIEGFLKLQRLKQSVLIAKEIILEYIGKHSLTEKCTELDILFKNYNEQKIFSVGNVISIPYYGKKLIYKIIQIKSNEDIAEDQDNDLVQAFNEISLTGSANNVKLYKALFSTAWKVNEVNKDEKEIKKPKYKIEDVGGYDSLVQDIKDVLDIGLGKCKSIVDFDIFRGILLYGPTGVGKSMIAHAVIAEYDVNYFPVNSADIYSKFIGETEKRVKEIFAEAQSKAPSIILLEDIDSLCPKRSSSNSDHERRVLATLLSLIDDLQNTEDKVIIIATTSKPDLVDNSLRKPGRIDKEFEILVPAPHMREQIIRKILSKIPNALSEKEIKNIAFVTHGFVGADLYGLCSQAIINATKRVHGKDQASNVTDVKLTLHDFDHALLVIKPLAMKEVLVEIPNVNWSDIGGQKSLKLKLKQAVEWPLKHPEAFLRMGIKPPRGVLMFGPPGCSKTMIAKALATESKINFLNIKGPELFSKWVGESERAVREVFRKARQVAPSIIFFDEIDALGGERASGANSAGSNVQERVLAQLLTELDGVTALGSVTLVAATNRPDRIDKALLRPGRLDRIIYVPLPDEATRQEIFEIKLRNMPVSKDVNILDLVELTEGYSGAEIQAICDEAAMKALEEDLNATIITKEHFKTALSTVTPRTPASLIKICCPCCPPVCCYPCPVPCDPCFCCKRPPQCPPPPPPKPKPICPPWPPPHSGPLPNKACYDCASPRCCPPTFKFSKLF